MGGQHRFYEVIANEAMMGILAFDLATLECVYVNRLARETLELGGDEADAIELDIDELMPEGDVGPRAQGFSRDMIKSEGFFQDVLLRNKTGHVIIANIGVRQVELDSGSGRLLVMFQDITIQKKLQREVQVKQEEIHTAFVELLEQNRQLKELDLAKDKFVALTTHELRTPLSALVATAEVLELELYESDEQKKSFIHTMYEQSLHLMELVNDILDFAKIRAGKMDFYVQHMDLAPVLEKVASEFDNMASKAEVTLELRQPSCETMIFADELRLREVLANVVNNAIKYNRQGGRVVISAEPIATFIRVRIADTGIGIPEAKLENVFNEFETIGSMARHHKGTGLGMPISRRLIESMGGKISVESIEKVGSTFFVDVPTEKILAEDFYRARDQDADDLAS